MADCSLSLTFPFHPEYPGQGLQKKQQRKQFQKRAKFVDFKILLVRCASFSCRYYALVNNVLTFDTLKQYHRQRNSRLQKEWFHRHFLQYSRSHFILGKVIFSLTSSLSFSVGLSTNNSLTLHDNKETSECSQTYHKIYLILHVFSIKSLAVAIFVLKLMGLSKVYWLASYQQKSP